MSPGKRALGSSAECAVTCDRTRVSRRKRPRTVYSRTSDGHWWMPKVSRPILNAWLVTLETLSEQIGDADAELKELAFEDARMRRLMTVPGVSPRVRAPAARAPTRDRADAAWSRCSDGTWLLDQIERGKGALWNGRLVKALIHLSDLRVWTCNARRIRRGSSTSASTSGS